MDLKLIRIEVLKLNQALLGSLHILQQQAKLIRFQTNKNLTYLITCGLQHRTQLFKFVHLIIHQELVRRILGKKARSDVMHSLNGYLHKQAMEI